MAGMTAMVDAATALPGRSQPAFSVPERHAVTGVPLWSEVPAGFTVTYLAMGCFWGAERLFWTIPGVWATAVGYMGGFTPFPTYEEVCTGRTGHTEAVQVVFDPAQVSYLQLLEPFWQEHDPTQGARQGNDIGTQYRSVIQVFDSGQRARAIATCAEYEAELTRAGYGKITTEIVCAHPLYFAEDYHQQYLAKNPDGYCGIGGTGVSCPSPLRAN